MASSKTVALFALIVLVQCTWIQCQVIGYPGGGCPYGAGGGFGGLLNTGCNDNNDFDALLPILLLSMVNKNNGGGCNCGGGCNGGCGGGCGRC